MLSGDAGERFPDGGRVGRGGEVGGAVHAANGGGGLAHGGELRGRTKLDHVGGDEIELGEKFFEEVIRNPVPLDLHILKSLSRSSLGLDLYLWLTYRTFALKAPMRLSWKVLYRQFGANPAKAGDARTIDYFRTDCLRELKKIKTAWPGLQYRTDYGVLVVGPSLPCIPPRHQLTD